MLYVVPDYYKEFQCIADRCEDTCCAGWQIVVDKKSLKKYKKVRGPYLGKMLRCVNWFEGTFRQDKNKRCAFLNENNSYGFIAKNESEIIGFAYGYVLFRPDGKKDFYLHAIDIDHRFQGNGYGTRLMNFIKDYIKEKYNKPGDVYLGLVHRLDRPTGGVMVFAKNQQAAAHLSKQVQERVIGKYYYAVSKNVPEEKEGVLENYLLTDKKTNYTQVVDDKTDGAKHAKLEYKVRGSEEGKTLFDIKLHTGRQHQIRVQMANVGCPLVGDSKYGNANEREQIALCSYKLEFEHPTKKCPMKFEIQPIGKVFEEFFA